MPENECLDERLKPLTTKVSNTRDFDSGLKLLKENIVDKGDISGKNDRGSQYL